MVVFNRVSKHKHIKTNTHNTHTEIQHSYRYTYNEALYEWSQSESFSMVHIATP